MLIDNICMFCGKFFACINICMFIIVKIKCMNFGRISDICDKINFTTYYTHFITPDINLSKHTQILQFLTPLADLRIS